MVAATEEAYRLFHEGAIALSRVEANGMRVDTEYLGRAIQDVTNRISQAETELQEDDVFKTWRKRFGSRTTLGNGDQLGQIVFEDLGFASAGRTSKGKHKTDVKSFEDVDLPFVKKYIAWKNLRKSKSTYLEGILRETCNGFLHCFFNLNIAISYRSSADTPNLQNMPIRDPAMSFLIRQCFIPRKNDWRLVEVDFSGIEVRVAGCYTKDPKLVKYIQDPTTDMHRDMACELYFLKPEGVSKTVRYCAKNMFVFPQFYGDWYISNCKQLWNSCHRMELTGPNGIPMKEHLRNNGIRKLGACALDSQGRPIAPLEGTFENHVMEVQERFWGKRFRVYAKRKREWWEDYSAKGYFTSFTGFAWEGVFDRKQVSNWRIQGSAFHCLLQALIELDRRLHKKKMKSKIICQIHDSIIGDCPSDEAEDFAHMAREVMTVWLPEKWNWICVPLEVEAEMTPPGRSWYEKKKYEF